MIVTALIGIVAILFIPCLIVALWRSRPRRAMFVACLVAFLILVIPAIYRTTLMVKILKADDLSAIVGLYTGAFLSAIFGMVICVPILFLFRWVIRKIFPDKVKTKNVFD